MNELSLFTGAGGGLLGTHLLGWRPVGYVEWNEYCQRVIAARIADGYLPAAPIFTDVREFVQSGAAEQYRGIADVVTGGFPCQPFSVAGKQQAADDERNMWPATRDVIRIVQPASVLLENVPGLISCGYLGTVIADLAALGYVGQWGVIGAADAGAPHRRDRLWIMAHAKSVQRDGSKHYGFRYLEGARENFGRLCESGNGSDCADVANSDGIRSSGSWWAFDPGDSAPSGDREINRTFYESRWGIESRMGRVANGVAYRVDRLKAIGNGQVPAVVARAWRELAA